jgi:anti-anti-sigma factor
MMCISNCNSPTAEYERYVPGEITELVRGNDKLILEKFIPLVCRQNVVLDLRTITRIDAAGLTALIRLYCAAREAGQSFTIGNPSAHVAEILRIVGLDRVLVSDQPGNVPAFHARLQETAA